MPGIPKGLNPVEGFIIIPMKLLMVVGFMEAIA